MWIDRYEGLCSLGDMPILNIRTNLELSEDALNSFTAEASRQVAKLLGKSESYVLVSISIVDRMTFGGTADPAAIVDLHSVGLSPEQPKELAGPLTQLIEVELAVLWLQLLRN